MQTTCCVASSTNSKKTKVREVSDVDLVCMAPKAADTTIPDRVVVIAIILPATDGLPGLRQPGSTDVAPPRIDD